MNHFSGDKSTLPVAWSLAGVFFITTMFFAVFTARKFLKRKCACENVSSEHEYVENTITQKPTRSTAEIPADLYNNHELYEL